MTGMIESYQNGRVSFAPESTPEQRAKIAKALHAVKGASAHQSDAIRLPRPYSKPRSVSLDPLRSTVARMAAKRFGSDHATKHDGTAIANTDLSVDRTDGHVAILNRGVAPDDGKRALPLWPSNGAPIVFSLDDTFWRAYSRVRTCRSGSDPFVSIGLTDDGGVILTSGSDADGFQAREPCHRGRRRGSICRDLGSLSVDAARIDRGCPPGQPGKGRACSNYTGSSLF